MIRLTEADVADLKRNVRGVIARLNGIEREALTQSRLLVSQARSNIMASVPDTPTPSGVDPFVGQIRTEFSRMATEFDRIIGNFAIDAANLGEQFAQQQAKAAGLDPAKFAGVGVSAGQVRGLSRALAAETSSIIQQVGSRVQSEAARAFLVPEPKITDIRRAVTDQMKLRAAGGGGLSGAIAKIASQIRNALGRFFSIASHEVQKAIEGDDPNVRKIWVTKGDAKVRAQHQSAGVRFGPGGTPGPLKVKTPFRIGGVRLRFPRDPEAKGSRRQVQAQVINCRCDSVLIRLEK